MTKSVSTARTDAPFSVAIAHQSQLTIDGLYRLIELERDLKYSWAARDCHGAMEQLRTTGCDVLICGQSLPGGTETLLDSVSSDPRTAVVLVVDELLDDALRGRMAAPACAKPALVHGCSPFSSVLQAAHAALSGRAWVDPVLVPELILHRDVEPSLLTPREAEVLTLVRRGAANKAIALELHIAGDTVKTHISSIMSKFGVQTRTAAATFGQAAARQAEEANQAFADMFHSSDDAIIVKDANHVVTQWNTAAARLYGYTTEEAVGMSGLLLSPRGARESEEALGRRVLAGKHMPNALRERVTKDGRTMRVSVTTSPVRDRTGAIVAISTIAREQVLI